MNFSAFNKLLFIIFVLSATSCSKKAETSTDTETAKEHWEKLSEELDEVFLEPLEKSMASENKSSSSTPKHSDKYGFENEHVYVDLGLSVYWAVENLGAYNPNGFGEYYCWANIVPSTDDDNEYPDEGLGNISGHPRYDAARAIWGGKWRLPTKSEFEELISNCTTENAAIDGITGKLFTSKINNAKLFLPYAGFKWTDEYDPEHAGEWGYYWSGIPSYGERAVALDISINRDEVSTINENISSSLPIRPVCNK